MDASCHDAGSLVMDEAAARTVAIAGNPNSGKSTVFNLLTGMRQHVGNYAGVTVERRAGHLAGREDVRIVDLPGTYSLNPRSLDEQIACDVLTDHLPDEPAPDVVVCVVDASNLERNLYLASQVLDHGIPTIIVLNMMDEVAKAGVEIDVAGLERALGAPVVPMIATRRVGLERLRTLLSGPLADPQPPGLRFDATIETAVDDLARQLATHRPHKTDRSRRAECMRVLANDRLLAYWQEEAPTFYSAVVRCRAAIEETGLSLNRAEVTARYAWLKQLVSASISVKDDPGQRSLSDRIDAVLLHRFLGPVIFAAILLLVFQAIFSWATPVMDLFEGAMLELGNLVRTALPPGWLADLLVDGVIAGVGNVVVFLPQILLLFFFLSLMESTGYMARSAFIMDRVMRRFGLSGSSVMPMMSAFACAVPAIMATRTMENHRDRLLTILVVPLMSCSARLPVYTLFIAAFIPAQRILGPIGLQGLTMFSLYLIGMVAAFVAASVLQRILKGTRTQFVLELPPYRAPQWRLIVWRMLERGKSFVLTAGKIIFLFSIVLWFAANYPKVDPPAELEAARATAQAQFARLATQPQESVDVAQRQQVEARLQQLSRQASAYAMEHSLIGRLGQVIEPVMRPLGFDWKLSAGILSAFAAREVIIGALGTIYSVEDADENSLALRDHLRTARDAETGRPLYSPLVALSLLVFFVLALQCTSTLAIARRELDSWRWPAFMWFYMTGTAYLAALVVYQGGLALGFG